MAQVSQPIIPFDSPAGPLQHPPRSSSVHQTLPTTLDLQSNDFYAASGSEQAPYPTIAPATQSARASQIIDRNLEIATAGHSHVQYYTDLSGQNHAAPDVGRVEYKQFLPMPAGLPEIAISGFDFEMEEEVVNNTERPATAASGDTYHQAQTLFQDFDGAHYAPSIREPVGEATKQESPPALRTPPALQPRYPPPAPGMVYYPAPVPMNLNLPKRIANTVPGELEAKRRSHMISTMNPDARKSAIWLKHERAASSGSLPLEESARKHKSALGNLPPQLRASVYFQSPGSGQDVEIKDRSAMLTLEDLLDASTSAPVSAFTDHMFTGHTDNQVYKREVDTKRQSTMSAFDNIKDKKRRSSFLGLRRKSITSEIALNDDNKQTKRRWSRSFSLGAKLDDSALNRDAKGNIVGKTRSGATTPMPDGDGSDYDEENDFNLEDGRSDMISDDEVNIGPPTTLLAELQLRKEAQKLRNRTALSAFPNGMHSTLLELDAVAQIQKKKRQNARVTLAWENPDHAQADKIKANDEDVPLGILFAGNGKVKEQLKERGMGDWDRPLGLIEMREREESEPLSFRRARLRGENPYQARLPTQSMMFTGEEMYQDNFEAIESDPEEVEETLAERLKRLKNKNETEVIADPEETENKEAEEAKGRPISKAFTDELLAELGLPGDDNKKSQEGGSNVDAIGNPQPNRSVSPIVAEEEEEETLGQRRARLQKMGKRTATMPTPQFPYMEASMIPQAPKPTIVRASTSLADLLHSVPSGTTRKVSDKQLVDSLPQDSLLKVSEDLRMARKEHIRASNMGGMPLVNLSDVDLRRNNGFKGGLYNNGFGGTNADLVGNLKGGPTSQPYGNANYATTNPDLMSGGNPAAAGMDVRQSVYGMGGGGSYAAAAAAASASDLLLQQAQLLNYQNAQIAQMMGLHMGVPYAQAPTPQPFVGAGYAAAAASSPNLLASGVGGGGRPVGPSNGMGGQMGQMNMPMNMQMQMRAAMPANGMPGFVQQQGGMTAESFLDANGRARIDAWRQSVQMD
jgi:hypothetical protein